MVLPYAVFAYCENLETIFIPQSITTIDHNALNLRGPIDVYYEGSEAQWSQISIGLGNYGLNSATFYYNWCKHKEGIRHNPEIKPSCTETGRIQFWYCSQCETYFTDTELTKPVDLEHLIVPSLGHAYTNGVCTRCGGADPTTVPKVTGQLEENIVVIEISSATAVESETIFCAVYDQNGKMIEIQSIQITIPAGNSKTENISLNTDIAKTDVVKAFFVGSNQQPKCSAIPIG